MKFLIKWILSFVLLGVFLAFLSCNFLSSSRGFQYTLISPEDLGIADIPNDKFFYTSLDRAYYIGQDTDPLDILIYSLDDGPGNDCKIPIEQASSEDIYCMMDIAEGDLWFFEFHLEYNVPPGMCDFMDFNVAWHYNQAVGNGPQHVVECPKSGGDDTESTYQSYLGEGNPKKTKCQNRTKGEEDWTSWGSCGNSFSFTEESGAPTCSNNGQIKCSDNEPSCEPPSDGTSSVLKCASGFSPTCKDDAPACTRRRTITNVGCVEGKTLPENTDKDEFRCVYECDTNRNTYQEVGQVCEYNKVAKDGLANCCFGSYNLYKEESIELDQKWGGNFRNCMGGPARMSWEHFQEDVPITLTTETLRNGLHATYEIPALLDAFDKSHSANKMLSFMTANYWEGVEDKASGLNRGTSNDVSIGVKTPRFYTMRHHTPPAGHSHLKNEQGNIVFRDGSPYLTWTCMDKHRDAKHRIHFIIREWNTQSEFLKFKESNGRNGDPNIAGTEGGNCDYYEPQEPGVFRFSNCNDMWSADDWSKGSSSEYPEIVYVGSGGGGGDSSEQ